jgi:hypothetical protein
MKSQSISEHGIQMSYGISREEYYGSCGDYIFSIILDGEVISVIIGV